MYEVIAKGGEFKLLTKEPCSVRFLPDKEFEASKTVNIEEEESGGYKISTLDAHEVLDKLNIPSAKGVSCTDPECKSPLGHRLRELSFRYKTNEMLLKEVRALFTAGYDGKSLERNLRNLLDVNREH